MLLNCTLFTRRDLMGNWLPCCRIGPFCTEGLGKRQRGSTGAGLCLGALGDALQLHFPDLFPHFMGRGRSAGEAMAAVCTVVGSTRASGRQGLGGGAGTGSTRLLAGT